MTLQVNTSTILQHGICAGEFLLLLQRGFLVTLSTGYRHQFTSCFEYLSILVLKKHLQFIYITVAPFVFPNLFLVINHLAR